MGAEATLNALLEKWVMRWHAAAADVIDFATTAVYLQT
jgi:hypothetical protein